MASLARHDPDELLKRVNEEERRARRGKLVVFFGAAPGVGKTYAMLEAARSERDLKRDVVIGVVETHGRYDTGALVIGLEILPRRREEHRGVILEEFDLDAALARKPGLILMDELAHTNFVSGSFADGKGGARHAKRWQDVEELLSAGIDVYTTLNVQHIESLNDVVAQITGIVVRETVPDRMLEEAAEVRLIDLPPGELLERLGEGKVYVAAQAERAAENFFRQGNLIALRELALRCTAERVDAQMRTYRAAHGIDRTWATTDRILVCVSPSPASARLVRGARRMAASLRAPWIAAYIETPATLRMSDADRKRVTDNLSLAEQLGAETAVLRAEQAAEETLRYARSRNVTKIVVGKPTHPRWRDLVKPSFLEEIVRASGDVDVYVISGEVPAIPSPAKESVVKSAARPSAYAASAAVVAVSTALSWMTFGQTNLADVVMVYLLGVIVVAMRFGFGPSIAAALLSVVSLDFFFVPPFFSFAVSDFQHVVTFGVMFVVAVVISTLMKRVRDQADSARDREQRTASLYGMSRELAASRGRDELVRVAIRHLRRVFDADVAVLLAGEGGEEGLENAAPTESFEIDAKERGVLEWVWRNGKAAGAGTDTLPFAKAIYVPLLSAVGAPSAPRERIGVLGVKPPSTEAQARGGSVSPFDSDRRQLLDVFAGQLASALDRIRLAEHAQRSHVEMEAERMRSSLLSSVSHDLRTPLTVITGAATALLEAHALGGPRRPDAAAVEHDLLETIHEEGERLNRLVRNLLDMTRIASGAVRITKEWQPLEEVVGAALNRLDTQLAGRAIDVRLPHDLPLVAIDAVLVEQLLINLLENAAKYTPEGSPMTISAGVVGDSVVVTIADRGPGIPKGQADKIFEKFHRLPGEQQGGGAGLGLAICRGVASAHGGRIWAENAEGGGALFHFSLPTCGAPPELPAEELS